MPLALALISFVFVEYFGLRTLGIRYLGKFINAGGFLRSMRLIVGGKFKTGLSGLGTGVINIFIGLLEGLSEFIRIISFTFRLFGNMTAGEILLLVATFLVPFLFAVVFYGLELLVGFVQALIFAGLTLIFLTVAVTSHAAEEAH
jgi:F-type H+-transporting ATPase subunit a